MWCYYLGLFFLGPVVLARFLVAAWFKRRSRVSWKVDPKAKFVAFFHPFCDSGGGGERVLWKMLASMGHLHCEKKKRFHVVVLAKHCEKTKEEILHRAEERFGIDVLSSGMPIDILFVPAWVVHYFTAAPWPRFTMIGQSLGSMMIALYGLIQATPDTFIDSTGAAFTFPVASLLFGCKCAAYVHYPTISTDMLSALFNRGASYNNDPTVANSKLASIVKAVYYFLFSKLYGVAGQFSSLTWVNSTWTHNHIKALWGGQPTILYPPVGVSDFIKKDRPLDQRKHVILSVAQFRPEKDHKLQLRAFAKLVQTSKFANKNAKLVLLGSCRDKDDERLVSELKRFADELKIDKQVEFVLNCSFETLQSWLWTASVGLHTMWNEHFGIGVVEMMAAGMITVAHKSGGPMMDIVKPTLDEDRENGVGYLANTDDTFAEALMSALQMDDTQRKRVTTKAIESCTRFSDESFHRAITACMLKRTDLF